MMMVLAIHTIAVNRLLLFIKIKVKDGFHSSSTLTLGGTSPQSRPILRRWRSGRLKIGPSLSVGPWASMATAPSQVTTSSARTNQVGAGSRSRFETRSAVVPELTFYSSLLQHLGYQPR